MERGVRWMCHRTTTNNNLCLGPRWSQVSFISLHSLQLIQCQSNKTLQTVGNFSNGFVIMTDWFKCSLSFTVQIISECQMNLISTPHTFSERAVEVNLKLTELNRLKFQLNEFMMVFCFYLIKQWERRAELLAVKQIKLRLLWEEREDWREVWEMFQCVQPRSELGSGLPLHSGMRGPTAGDINTVNIPPVSQ